MKLSLDVMIPYNSVYIICFSLSGFLNHQVQAVDGRLKKDLVLVLVTVAMEEPLNLSLVENRTDPSTSHCTVAVVVAMVEGSEAVAEESCTGRMEL